VRCTSCASWTPSKVSEGYGSCLSGYGVGGVIGKRHWMRPEDIPRSLRGGRQYRVHQHETETCYMHTETWRDPFTLEKYDAT
jgi:hypothetical protein